MIRSKILSNFRLLHMKFMFWIFLYRFYRKAKLHRIYNMEYYLIWTKEKNKSVDRAIWLITIFMRDVRDISCELLHESERYKKRKRVKDRALARSSSHDQTLWFRSLFPVWKMPRLSTLGSTFPLVFPMEKESPRVSYRGARSFSRRSTRTYQTRRVVKRRKERTTNHSRAAAFPPPLLRHRRVHGT